MAKLRVVYQIIRRYDINKLIIPQEDLSSVIIFIDKLKRKKRFQNSSCEIREHKNYQFLSHKYTERHIHKNSSDIKISTPSTHRIIYISDKNKSLDSCEKFRNNISFYSRIIKNSKSRQVNS